MGKKIITYVDYHGVTVEIRWPNEEKICQGCGKEGRQCYRFYDDFNICSVCNLLMPKVMVTVGYYDSWWDKIRKVITWLFKDA